MGWFVCVLSIPLKSKCLFYFRFFTRARRFRYPYVRSLYFSTVPYRLTTTTPPSSHPTTYCDDYFCFFSLSKELMTLVVRFSSLFWCFFFPRFFFFCTRHKCLKLCVTHLRFTRGTCTLFEKAISTSGFHLLPFLLRALLYQASWQKT